jgi:hypothetical protein
VFLSGKLIGAPGRHRLGPTGRVAVSNPKSRRAAGGFSAASGSEPGSAENAAGATRASAAPRRWRAAENGQARQAAWVDTDGAPSVTLGGPLDG